MTTKTKPKAEQTPSSLDLANQLLSNKRESESLEDMFVQQLPRLNDDNWEVHESARRFLGAMRNLKTHNPREFNLSNAFYFCSFLSIDPFVTKTLFRYWTEFLKQKEMIRDISSPIDENTFLWR